MHEDMHRVFIVPSFIMVNHQQQLKCLIIGKYVSGFWCGIPCNYQNDESSLNYYMRKFHLCEKYYISNNYKCVLKKT